jgi:hypothetical protein
MNIGTKVYKPYVGYRREKITFTDENGIEWHRYHDPNFYVKELIIVGKVEHAVTGRIPEDNLLSPPDLETEYYASHFDNDNKERYIILGDEDFENIVFFSRESAQAKLDSMIKEYFNSKTKYNDA